MVSASIIMPVYNVEKYVARSIQSALAQTYKDFELVLIIDGSKDSSLAICESFNDPRIRIVKQENRGLAGARNTGIREARGKYIALLDSDDLWHEQKLERHIRHLESNPKIGVSYSGSVFIDDNDELVGVSMRPKLYDITAAHIFCRNPVGNGSAPVFRKQVFVDIGYPHSRNSEIETAYFNESFRFGEDIECWMRIACNSNWLFEGIEGDLTLYRIVSGGLSANTEKMYEFWQRMYKNVNGYAPELISECGEKARAYQLRYYARRAVREGQGKAAVSHILGALRASPMILFEEPRKTIITAAAALLSWVLPSMVYRKIEELVLTRS